MRGFYLDNAKTACVNSCNSSTTTIRAFNDDGGKVNEVNYCKTSANGVAIEAPSLGDRSIISLSCKTSHLAVIKADFYSAADAFDAEPKKSNVNPANSTLGTTDNFIKWISHAKHTQP